MFDPKLEVPSLELCKDEIWKDIKGYEGLYQVSNFGGIRSLKRKNGYGSRRKTHLKKFKITRYGRAEVGLSKNGKLKTYFVHRLVAKAFIPNPFDKPCINHKDGNPLNNNVNNLEWVTYKENDLHARRNKLYAGEKNNTAKLREKDVLFIRNNYGRISYKELARKFNIVPNHVYKVVKRYCWKYI